MNNLGRNLALWAIIALLIVALLQLIGNGNDRRDQQPDLAFSEFIAEVELGNIREVTIRGNDIAGKYENGLQFKTYAPNDPDLVRRL